MKKLGQIILSGLMISSFVCSSPVYAKSENVWAVDPIYEWDDIDVNFNDTVAGAKAFYGSDTAYQNFKSGGVAIQSHGLYGFMNGKGKVKEIPHWSTYGPSYVVGGSVITNQEFQGYTMGSLEEDYTVKHSPTGIGGTLGGMSGYWKKEGEIGDASNTGSSTSTKSDLYESAVSSSKIKEGDYLLYRSYINPNYGYDIPDDYVESYVLFNTTDYKVLDNIPVDTVVQSISNQTILVSKATESANSEGIRTGKPSDYSEYQFYSFKGKQIGETYEQAYGFYEGLAPVKKDGKWGYINKKGKVVVDFVFDKATPISKGKAWVTYKGRTGRLKVKKMIKNKIKFDDSNLNVNKYKVYQDDTLYIQTLVDSINLRSEPSKDGDSLGKINADIVTSAYQKEEAGGYTWYLIEENGSGQEYWIADQDGSWIQELS